MPKFFRKKAKHNLEKTWTAKSGWIIWMVIKYMLITLAVLLFVGEVFWLRAGFELANGSISGMTQRETLCKLIVEYVTDPGTLTGFASLVLSYIAYSFERRQKEEDRDKNIGERLERMRSLPYLQRLRKYIELEKEGKEKSWPQNRIEELQQECKSFSEREFLWELGDHLQEQNDAKGLSDIQELYNHFFDAHKDSISTLTAILNSLRPAGEALPIISAIMKLWDDFDIDAKDTLVGALKRLAQKVDLPSIPATELLTQVFANSHRRRLLRDVEIKTLFPQLDSVPPVGYDAQWLRLPNPPVNPRVIEWLKQHDLAVNPFGTGTFTNYLFYPEGFLSPDQWIDFLAPLPQCAQCPTPKDARALVFLLRSECLPTKRMDEGGNEIVYPGRQVFPVWVLLGQTVSAESPLPALARSAAQAWLDILPFSPDAMLDLLPAERTALLELLCWSFGSNITVINLFKRAGLKDDVVGNVIVHKLQQFESKFSSAHLPSDSVLISWLKIRPPDTNYTYLILPLDEFPASMCTWWLEQFSPLIPTLFLRGVVVKAFSSSRVPLALPLPEIRLHWSDLQLKKSLDSQFNLAVEVDKETNRREKERKFYELFGPFGSVKEKDTTDKLVSASHNSLARMLTLGNHLLEKHCEEEVLAQYLSLDELQAILKSA